MPRRARNDGFSQKSDVAQALTQRRWDCRPLPEPAGHVQRFAGDAGRAFRGEEGDGRGDLLDLADAAYRGGGFDPGAQLAFMDACGLDALTIMPGLTALTRILRAASSFDSTAVMASTDALAALVASYQRRNALINAAKHRE